MSKVTEYKYIHFVHLADKAKTSVWSCRNNRSGLELGRVEWGATWRQYIYAPTCPAIYSVGCLTDIQDFIGQLSDERKASKP